MSINLFSTLAKTAATVDANLLPDVDFNDFQQLWFSNYVNHFDFQDTTTYQQRYWVNEKYWTDKSGPNFIYFCGEYTCSPPAERHFPFMVGANKNARLFVIEHRYYGASQPCSDWSVECYKHLNSEQGLADFAHFLTTMNADMPSRKTIVIGGSYPGALSAWFRDKYPNIATASWAASAVVQPLEDMWSYDEQVYLSTTNIGPYCSETLVRMNIYATEQGVLRDSGKPNAIDDIIVGTPAEGMLTADFLSYVGDFPAGQVQYGHSKRFCESIFPLVPLSDAEVFDAMIRANIAAGDTPEGYDSRPGAKVNSIEIDVDYSGRSWTYQYCTEFGWFQTASKLHRVRSQYIDNNYWLANCQMVFPELDMSKFPAINRTEDNYGGNKIAASNIFFTNGWEDPWKWVTQLSDRPEINQRSRVSDCIGCGHCADLYTPQSNDPLSLKETRQQVYNWITDILDGTAATTAQFIQ